MPKFLRKIIIVIAALTFIGSASYLAWMYYQTHAGDAAYEKIINEVVSADESADLNNLPEEWPVIDFEALLAINRDIIAWIYIPDTPISYPVLRGETNQTYIRATYERKYNILGSIFQDCRNDAEFNDHNTIIYGHNTRSGSMFGSLKKHKDQAYAQEHKDIYILRKNETLIYEVFAVYETSATSDTYTINFSSKESYTKYLENMSKRTVTRVGDPPASERIITLSTCTGGDQSLRLVIQAKLVGTII